MVLRNFGSAKLPEVPAGFAPPFAVKARLLYLGMLLAGPLQVRAQALRAATPASLVSYFTQDFQPTSAIDSMAFCAETTFRDSLNGVTRVYYPSGHLKQYIPYANVGRAFRHGCLTTWYEDGQMCTKEDYVRGVRHGDLLTYYPDGTLKRRERYENGRCGVGTCYDATGRPVPYFTYEQLPLYPGGDVQLVRELTKAVRLNSQERDAMRRESHRMMNMARYGMQRQVDVELSVAPDGRVTNARVVHSTAGFLNNAALRAVTMLKRQFIPGRRDGQVLMSFLTVPLYYTLEAPYNSPYQQGGYRARQRF
jgi:protein TonB